MSMQDIGFGEEVTEQIFKESEDDNLWGGTDIIHTEGDDK